MPNQRLADVACMRACLQGGLMMLLGDAPPDGSWMSMEFTGLKVDGWWLVDKAGGRG
jgi:hypothetical protein